LVLPKKQKLQTLATIPNFPDIKKQVQVHAFAEAWFQEVLHATVFQSFAHPVTVTSHPWSLP
jgi:hypothetical protein